MAGRSASASWSSGNRSSVTLIMQTRFPNQGRARTRLCRSAARAPGPPRCPRRARGQAPGRGPWGPHSAPLVRTLARVLLAAGVRTALQADALAAAGGVENAGRRGDARAGLAVGFGDDLVAHD